jgi:hypothetical protein
MITVATVARFSRDGRVWRAFDCLLAAGPGTLLLVPVGLAEGDLTRVVDGCPVPWPEVWAVLDAPAEQVRQLPPEALAKLVPLAAAWLTPFGWERDVVPARESVPTMTRLRAPDGVRLALLGAGQGGDG